MSTKAHNKNKKMKRPTASQRTAPVNTSSSIITTVATTKSSKSGMRIAHKEFFSTVCSSSAANIDGTFDIVWYWTIQPGYADMFPWLSGIARRYEKYHIHDLSFEFIPRVPTSTSGTIVIALDQDPDDELPDSDEEGRRTLLAHQGAKSASIWSRQVMNYPASWNKTGERFVRVNGETTTVEPRTADMGILYVGMYGVPVNTICGDLLVRYDIELSLPQLFKEPTTEQTSLSVESPTSTYVNGILPLTPYPTSLPGLSMKGPLGSVLEIVLSKSNMFPSGTYGLRYVGEYNMAGKASFNAFGTPSGDTAVDQYWAVFDGSNLDRQVGTNRVVKAATQAVKFNTNHSVMVDSLCNLILRHNDVLVPFLEGTIPPYWYNMAITFRDMVASNLGATNTEQIVRRYEHLQVRLPTISSSQYQGNPGPKEVVKPVWDGNPTTRS